MKSWCWGTRNCGGIRNYEGWTWWSRPKLVYSKTWSNRFTEDSPKLWSLKAGGLDHLPLKIIVLRCLTCENEHFFCTGSILWSRPPAFKDHSFALPYVWESAHFFCTESILWLRPPAVKDHSFALPYVWEWAHFFVLKVYCGLGDHLPLKIIVLRCLTCEYKHIFLYWKYIVFETTCL